MVRDEANECLLSPCDEMEVTVYDTNQRQLNTDQITFNLITNKEGKLYS